MKIPTDPPIESHLNAINPGWMTLIAVLLAGGACMAAEPRPVVWWAMDAGAERAVRDVAGGIDDRIDGYFTPVAGVRGGAIRFDGYSTEIRRPAGRSPKLSGGFAVEGRVALGAYPWNWCPLVSQCSEGEAGFRVEIGPRGQLRMQVRVGDEWVGCESGDFVVGLRSWIHLAASYDPASGIKLFADGAQVGDLQITGDPVFARDVGMVVGTGHGPSKPSNLHRDFGTLESWFSLDGILDEVKVYDQPLDAPQVARAFAADQATAGPDLPPRVLPSGPPGPGRFGAYYSKLEYYPEWDALWPVGDDPDVIVRFDSSPARVVFWRGTRYSPAWVSGNGLWMADQSVEAWNNEQGCFEHMQDRRCRYSHVRIIESHDARVVVHWRYAPVSAHNELWREDPKTTRACWVDEYYYIYPDAAGIRNVSWKSGTLGGPRQFQESLPLTHPGQYPLDVVDPAWATIANYAGETAVLRYRENPPKERDDLPDALTIQSYNFKSEQKPFICFEPGNRMKYLADRDIRSIQGPGSCNHWPVGQAICDGRTSQSADRPTHFCGFPISDPPIHDDGERESWHGFYGMTEGDMPDLVRLGRSWAQAAALENVADGLSGGEYDRGQRAYVLRRPPAGGEMAFTLAADQQSPVIHPAFVIEGWRDDGGVAVEIDGKTLERGTDCRIGRVERLEDTSLVLWLKLDTESPVRIRLIPTT
jgi:hypothetical protein